MVHSRERRRAMEDASRRSGHGGLVKEEMPDSHGEEEDRKQQILSKVGNNRPYSENDAMKPSSPNEKELSRSKQVPILSNAEKSSSSTRKEQDDQLESARAEMGEVKEENQRLKMYLNQIMKDYQALQMQFYQIIQQDSKKSPNQPPPERKVDDHHQQEVEEPELFSLGLGRLSSDSKKDNEKNNKAEKQEDHHHDHEQDKEGLTLGLNCKFESSTKSEANEALPDPSDSNSSEERKEDAAETWPPSKVLKTLRNGDHEEALQQNPVKKARVSVRARCDTPTMNDGCQWRKYGQKIAKGNPCPRAYYRCTVAPSCPVRKQVQRCAEDMSILITTYEGTHNHPLPMSATAMASTTSAAASMLLSGSSSSSRPGSNPPMSAANSATATNLQGLNFYLSDNSKPKQFFLPNSTLSSSSSYPTITLDLTSTPSSSTSPFNRFSSVYPQAASRYPSASLNFSSSSEPTTLSWGSSFFSYGSTQPAYMKNNQIGALNLGRQPIENNIYQSFLQKNNVAPPQQSLPDTIAAATKAITADPSFQSALAAALTSIMGSGSNAGSANQNGVDENKLKWSEAFPVASGYSVTAKGNGCASSYLNKAPSAASQPGSFMFLPPSLPFSTSKSASASPSDTRDHSN